MKQFEKKTLDKKQVKKETDIATVAKKIGEGVLAIGGLVLAFVFNGNSGKNKRT